MFCGTRVYRIVVLGDFWNNFFLSVKSSPPPSWHPPPTPTGDIPPWPCLYRKAQSVLAISPLLFALHGAQRPVVEELLRCGATPEATPRPVVLHASHLLPYVVC